MTMVDDIYLFHRVYRLLFIYNRSMDLKININKSYLIKIVIFYLAYGFITIVIWVKLLPLTKTRISYLFTLTSPILLFSLVQSLLGIFKGYSFPDDPEQYLRGRPAKIMGFIYLCGIITLLAVLIFIVGSN